MSRRVTRRLMTRFELAKILGTRAEQITDPSLSKGFPIAVEVPEGTTNPLKIALMELEQKKSPVKVYRTIPGFPPEVWDPAEMILPTPLPEFPDKS